MKNKIFYGISDFGFRIWSELVGFTTCSTFWEGIENV